MCNTMTKTLSDSKAVERSRLEIIFATKPEAVRKSLKRSSEGEGKSGRLWRDELRE